MERRRFVFGLVAGAGTVACSVGTGRAVVDAGEPDDDQTRASNAVTVGGAELTVIIEGDSPSMPRSAYEGWVRTSAQMIADYYGGTLPVPGLEITLLTSGGGAIGYGNHRRGRWIRVYCGRRTRQRSFDRDWVMVHEMLHATFPDLTDRHRWMQEGLSTYAEKLVRVRAGNITQQQVWSRLSGSMHHGRPRAGDRGLDITHTWGRTYWGGALFWMVADIEIREQTRNRKSLDDALRHIAAIGGNARQMWETERVCAEADEGTGTRVVSRLYARMAEAPGDIDLDRLWQDLGVVRLGDGSVELDDEAPRADIRRGICGA